MQTAVSEATNKPSTAVDWNAMLTPYKRSSLWRSLFQILNTAVPFFTLWSLMLATVDGSYGLTLLLAVPTALFLVRLFILQHDCGHGAFFASRRWNDAVGFVIGVLTLVPYTYWRKTHAIHHATSGKLDERTYGDISTLTVREYLHMAPSRRALYRLYRHPIVMLVIGPAYQFIFKHRFPADAPREWKREWASVHWTNLALILVVVALGLTIGFKRFLLIQLPITLIAASTGVFLFYMQHQYEDTYWRYGDEWDYFDAGLKGSSHFDLPKVLQWLTGNIGLHHIHHVDSRIPNYFLQRCYDENPELRNATKLGIWQSVKTLWLTLWDEQSRKLVRFADVEAILRRPGGVPPLTPAEMASFPRAWQ
jgi:omega-6 fatty acid desaturase (delta-12 desaturase)